MQTKLPEEARVESEKSEVAAERTPRYLFVDALRGLAALLVLLHHLTFMSLLRRAYSAIFPSPLLIFMEVGKYGVEIFFILSGFVIAHSVRKFRWTGNEVGNFILRRQLRLDPPYWAILILTLIEQAVMRHVPHVEHYPAPSGIAILANLFYLQKLTQVQPIVLPAWTLCIEIQFYLFFVLICFSGFRLARRFTQINGLLLAQTLTVLLGLLSLVVAAFRPQWFVFTVHGVHPEWFGDLWFYFAAGAYAYWTVRQQTKPSFFLTYMLVFVGIAIVQRSTAMAFGATTALTLYAVGRTGHLSDWLTNPILQYLGRISYSLYIVQFLVGIDVLRIGYKISGLNHVAALVWYVLAGAVSILCAHLLHHFVEKPSMQFAARLKSNVARGTSTA